MAATIPTNGIVLNSGLNVADGDITMASGHGINFAATSDAAAMAAELLDDYEEGTWTIGLVDTSANAITTDFNEGRYTKIGRQVYVNVWVRATSLGSASGNISGTGLPFTVSNANSAYAGNQCTYGTGLHLENTSNGFACMADKNATTLWFRHSDNDDGYNDQLTAAQISANGSWMFQFTYTTDS